MEPNSKEGIFLIYGPAGSLEIMDRLAFENHRKFELLNTKDFQAFSETFPFREIVSEEERSEDKETYNVEFVTRDMRDRTYVDKAGHLRCSSN